MAKSKQGGSAPPKSQSEDSVRSKIINIEEGLGSLTSSLRNMNQNLMINNDWSESIFQVHGLIFKTMARNIEIMAQAMLGLDVKDSLGNKMDYSGMKVQGGSGLEAAAEGKKREDKRDEQEEQQTEAQKKQAKILEDIHRELRKGSILDILIGAAAGLAGLVVGLVGQYMKIFAKVLKPIIGFFKGQGVMVEKLMSVLRGGWESFVSVLTKLKTLFVENKFVSGILDMIKGGWNKFTGYLKGIGTLFSEVASLWGKLFGSGGDGFLTKFFGYFQAIGQRLGIFFELGKKLGAIIGKIAIPIQVIMSIFDTVTGALDGWEKTEGGFLDKLTGAIKGGLTGLLNGLIGGLLDLLKDGASWILGMLGFDEASKALDSFSFQEVIKNAVDGIVDFFMTPVKMIQEIVKAFKGEISWGEMFKNMMATMISGLLAPFNGLAKLAGIDLKSKVLDLLGLPDPKGSGGGVQATGETGVATKALEKTTNENTQAKDAAASTAAAVSAASNNSNSSQVVNNNTTQAAIIRAKTTNWEPDDQWARGGGMAYGA